MAGRLADVLAAFAVVFLAELGDKTQLVALTLAGRYPAVKVLAANSERVFKALLGSGAVTVERNSEAVHTQF